MGIDVGSVHLQRTSLYIFRFLNTASAAAMFCGVAAALTVPGLVAGSGNPDPLAPRDEATPFFSPADSTTAGRSLGTSPDSLRMPGGIIPRTHADSLAARRDSTGLDSLGRRKFVISDSTYVVCTDSSARLRYFNFERHDDYTVPMFQGRPYPLRAARRSNMYRRGVIIDSTGENVSLTETVDGVNMKAPVTMSLKEYVDARQRYELHKIFADEARRPQALLQKNDLGELLGNITKISIPVPPNPLFSIFGKNEINLTIGGAVDIKAGFSNIKSDQTTLSSVDQSRNEPDFSQEVQVNVNGTIGDKLNIMADWNTRRTFEYENQLKIKYTGYDDEIVQSVEAGNVSLQGPSLIGSSQALFGIKAKIQTGPLTLTTVASQKKGQIKEVQVSGGAQEHAFEMRAFEYATNHFFVDTTYALPLNGSPSVYEDYYQNEPAHVRSDMQILEAEVWVQRQGSIPDPNERPGIGYIELPARGSGYDESRRGVADVDGQIESGQFVRLDPTQYELEGDGFIGVVALNTNVNDQYNIAIAYRTSTAQFGELTRNVGNDSTARSTRLILKMLKPRNLLSVGPTYKKAWSLLLKNIYPLSGVGRNLKQAGFSMNILRRIPGSEDQNSILNEPLLRVMGVDKRTADGSAAPDGDGLFDFVSGRTVNLSRAEIILPYLRPFDKGIKAYFASRNLPVPDSTYLYSEIYDTTQTFAQQSERNRYVFSGKATGEASNQYSIGFNVVEGSVQVSLDGRALTLNVDYTVDYIVGQVVIKNERALVPGANLSIKFEQNDLFQLASKTLLGVRGDVAVSPSTTFGFTIMNLNQQTLSDKVRLGEEPNSNTIFGVDGTTTVNLPFLTRALDALPVLNTREPSSLRISGEAAYMLPDPNTKKSTIPSDGGAGVAYIDDFEGARRTVPVGVSMGMWTIGGPPEDSVANSEWGESDSVKMLSKGKVIWYNRLPTDVQLTDVWPNKQPGNNNTTTVMNLYYFPTQRGSFNYASPQALSSTLTPVRNWGSVMKPLSISAVNLLKENVDFIELWMLVEKAPPNGKMIIDLGAISEDVIPNNALNSEDLVLSSSPNGVLQEGEDIGLDMMSDAQEQARYPDLGPDPSGDDYSYSNTNVGSYLDFLHINGTENNKDGPSGRVPDTEDINANGYLDKANSYFQYELLLDTVAARNPRIVGGGDPRGKHYYQFRIPIREFTRVVGSPSFENVGFIRVTFMNTDTTFVRIADFNLVGSQWQKLTADPKDASFSVTTVGIEENPSYVSPPGVQRERDLTQPDQNILANEQSLVMQLNNVPDGESRQAVKYYTYKSLDVFDYRTMKMYVHGDDKFKYIDTSDYDAEVFFRFGADSLNFYEYRAPLRPGWDPLNDITIQFSALTAIKQARDSTTALSKPTPVPGGPPHSFFRVLGNPSLTQIAYLAIGVENPVGKGTSNPLQGEVWFDELRLISPDDTPGWAYRFDTQLKLADFATVAANYSRIDPAFHSLESRFGSRQLSTSWGLNATVSLDKLLPDTWAGSTMPVSYTHSESNEKPKYLANSDIDVNQAAAQLREKILQDGGTAAAAQTAADSIVTASQTHQVTDTYAAPTFRIAFPSQAWYIRDTFNKLSFGFTYTKSKMESPSVVQSVAWSWNAHMGYAVTLPPDYYISPFKHLFDGVWFLDEYKNFRLFFPLTGFNWSVNATRTRSTSLQRVDGATDIISRQFSATRGMGFGWKLTEGGILNLSGDYSVSVNSSLLDMELDANDQQRSFSSILRDIFFHDHLINFGKDTQYGQKNTFNTKPNIPNIFNIKKYIDLTFTYGVDYSWQNSLTQGDAGKQAGFSNSVSFQFNFKLKQLFDPLFSDKPSFPMNSMNAMNGGRGRRGGPEPGSPPITNPGAPPITNPGAPPITNPGAPPITNPGAPPIATPAAASPDTTLTARDTTGGKGMEKTMQQLKNLARIFIKIPLLDYDNINVSFTQSNSAQNSGVVGGTGFVNFWGRMPFFQSSLPENGPSALYQLGLISDPSGRLTDFGPRSKFPFFGWDVEPGIRAKGLTLINTYREQNRLALKTTRDLWEGAHLDLNWSVGWSYTRSQNVQTDSITGAPTIISQSTSGNIDRSFLTFPDFLFFSIFKTSLKQVSKEYADLKSNGDSSMSDAAKLNQAFEHGFEAFPILRKVFGQFLPRVNWSLRWDGLEKIPMFTKFVSRLSLDHSYTSNYTRQYENSPGSGGEITDAQRVAYGFAPLVGLNCTFKELLKGNFGANIKYNTNTAYDLATSSQNIVETLAQEVSVTASYSRKGFEIPFFGLSLNNDIDISMSYSVTKNSKKTYDVSTLDVNPVGVPIEGSTRTVMEPRIKYVLSARVTASVYYRYTKIAPDDAGSLITGSTTNEAGLDLHIAIQ